MSHYVSLLSAGSEYCLVHQTRHSVLVITYIYVEQILLDEYNSNESLTATDFAFTLVIYSWNNNTTTLHPFNGLHCTTTRISRYQKGKTCLDVHEARDGDFGVAVASAGPYAKQSAPLSRQITTPTHHHSVFTGQMLVLMPNQPSWHKQY